MLSQLDLLLHSATSLAQDIKAQKIFLFLNSAKECNTFLHSQYCCYINIVLVIPKTADLSEVDLSLSKAKLLRSWAGNQSRFSRIKYAFLHAIMEGIIEPHNRIVCLLGPWGKSHYDTIIIHDLDYSWSDEFPFDPRKLANKKSFHTIIAIMDIALDIGALGREGKSVGTIFIIGDTDNVLKHSRQAIFNPFKGYSEEERAINKPGVVESIKELAKIDGAFLISNTGTVIAAGRHLDARSTLEDKHKGFGSRHRAASGITAVTKAIAIVVSESTGRVTVMEKGKVVLTLEPVISRRLE